MKRTLLLTVLAMALATVWAQGPNGSGTYYQAANGLKGKALKTKLAGIIVNPRNVGYDGLWEAYKKTDTRPDGYVRDWYSNATNYKHIVDKAGTYKNEGDCYNREHTVPQDWFSGSGIKSDIVHVVPTDGKINGYRSNHPFGEVGNNYSQSKNGYSKWGNARSGLGFSGTVFEPNDEIKGDIARIYFYMITRYEDQCGGWGHDVFTKVYPGLTQWTLDMMMRWSKMDPVDEREVARNKAVFEVQGNRNPYVDYPGLEEYTWGSKMDEPFSYDNYEGTIDPNFVYQPTFSPAGGMYKTSVEVTITTATEGASIYYTLDGSDATTSSTLYNGPITLTETTTIKAIAEKDGNTSSQTTATYTVITGGGGDTPVDGAIGLNDNLFGTSYGGTISSSDKQTLTGTLNGVTVEYALGSGSNRYCNSSQIRLYPGNTLTFSVDEGSITAIEFTVDSGSPSTSGLSADTGTMTGLTWSGDAQSVTFTFSGSKHIRITSVKVTVSNGSDPTGIRTIDNGQSIMDNIYFDLSGRMIQGVPTQKGVYIVNGKKVVIK